MRDNFCAIEFLRVKMHTAVRLTLLFVRFRVNTIIWADVDLYGHCSFSCKTSIENLDVRKILLCLLTLYFNAAQYHINYGEEFQSQRSLPMSATNASQPN